MTHKEKKPGTMKPGKLMALTLLLTVPVMMTGCGSLADDDECNPEFDECEYDSSTGVYYFKGKKKSSGVMSSGTSSKSYNGFGTGGSGGSGG